MAPGILYTLILPIWTTEVKLAFIPFLGGAQRGLMGYDRNSKQFVSYDLNTAQASVPSNYCFKMNSKLAAAEGMELIHMQYVNSLSQVHAIIKNPSDNAYYKYGYKIAANESNQYRGVLIEEEISTLGDAALMEQAEHIIIERRNGYIYFSIGNKLYNYRVGSGIDACVELEYEFDEITHLTVDNINNTNVIGIATYSEANGGKVFICNPKIQKVVV
ncbi:MAG: hypothetical protein LIO65_01605 [Odoribacter sp.]|nr:hypothetical protein [Odoribacter sp.]